MVIEAADRLTAELHRLGDAPGQMSDDQACRFLEEFPLDVLFGQLQASPLDDAKLQAACGTLDKLFGTRPGAALLPKVAAYGAAALHSPEHSLRQLGAKQLGRILLAEAQAGSDGSDVLTQLVDTLADVDTGVSHTAAAALQRFATTPEGFRHLVRPNGGGDALQRLLASGDAAVRVRALALVAELAGTSHDNLEQLRAAGLLNPLLAELRDPSDVLGCVGALQLLHDLLGACPAASAPPLYRLCSRRLAALLDERRDAALRQRALGVLASLLGRALDCLPEGAGATQLGASAEAVPPADVAAALRAALDMSGPEDESIAEAALDAVVHAGGYRGGAEFLLTCGLGVVPVVATLALGRTAARQLRIAALHSLASVCGTERAAAAGGGSQQEQQTAPLLSAAAEHALKAALYEGAGARSLGSTPLGVLWELLQQPFPETRMAVYRLLAGLCSRAWVAAGLLSNDGMVQHLCDPGSESSKQLCEWRYTALTAVAATCRRGALAAAAAAPHLAEAMQAAAPRLDQAVRRGPFGGGGFAGQVVPEVATATR